MTDDPAAHGDEVLEAYQRAAEVGGRAPSVHNTQPWRWLATRSGLELRADRSRQLHAADPDGRLLTISCGAALHHARLALHAAGWVPQVARMPDARSADALAEITVSGHGPTTAQQRRLFDEIDIRHTDRRPTVERKVPHDALQLIRQAAVDEGAGLHWLAEPDLDDLAVAAARANEIGLADPDQRAEMDYWVGGTRPTRTGVPSDAVPQSAPQTDVPGRDFGRPGTLDAGHGHARSAVYGLLFTSGDQPGDWLRAGEALSACWLKATDLGVAVLPLSSVVEVPATREIVHRMLAGAGYPMLVLRFGLADQDQAPVPGTPRLPAERTTWPGQIPQP
ncbi:NAD(P)H nitroreductase [Catellatospora sp. IY07-71]|uniref:Acg family FMN-binding oxidoreductase n=1 Tax=Catellatospora sp. IY07-71 TaxID=2728827 RepID=UPI001BB45A8B|nr:nitroreductase [Catellatospora sp. IY07-71]BCJ75206.1 NAD(P)H nitroreductase [Catellatospora sp. IY07-71]